MVCIDCEGLNGPIKERCWVYLGTRLEGGYRDIKEEGYSSTNPYYS
jgi:hypothetical protein